MEIHVRRVRQGKNSTLSEIYIEDEFMCYGLEDLIREEKVPGITAIPAGRYKLEFRQHGGMDWGNVVQTCLMAIIGAAISYLTSRLLQGKRRRR